MKKRIAAAVLLSVILLLSGCTQSGKDFLNINGSKTTANSLDIKGMDKKNIDAAFYVNVSKQGANENGNDIADQKTVVFDGKPVELNCQIENGPKACSVGLILFADGIRQPYKIDGGKVDMINSVSIKENEKKSFHIEFEPVTGKKGEELTLHIAAMVNPDYKPASVNDLIYGSNHKTAILVPWTIKMNENGSKAVVNIKSISEQKKISETVKKEYTTVSPDGSTQCSLDQNDYFQIGDGKTEKIILKKGINRLKLTGLGMENSYRVSVYINHKIMKCFNGTDYNDIEIKDDYQASCSFLIDADQLNGINTIYAVAVPLKKAGITGTLNLVKTQSLQLIKEN